MTRIKDLRKILGYTQDRLAKLLNVSRSTVAMWETSDQSPDYSTMKKIGLLFNVPSDYIMGEGVFEKWDEIIEKYEDVESEFLRTIPRELEMPSFCGEKTVCSWLYTRLYSEPDELQLVRWFAFSVLDVKFDYDNCYDDGKPRVIIKYTPEFNALIGKYELTDNRNNIALTFKTIPLKIPVYADVAAGLPIEATENIVDYEEIDVAMAFTGEYFGLRVKGDSMEPRIREGDVLIVRKQEDADTGDIAIVMVNGDSATVKRIKKEPSGISLIPNNPAYDIMFYANEEIESKPVRIIGKVVELRGKF